MTYITATGPMGAEGRYWDALLEGHLELPRCKSCDHWHWPAVWRCGECGSWDQEWVEQLLTGTIFSWTRTHHAFGGTEGIEKPFVSVLATLDSVPVRLIGLLKGEETNLAIGAKVSGNIGKTQFGENQIPAIRWSLA